MGSQSITNVIKRQIAEITVILFNSALHLATHLRHACQCFVMIFELVELRWTILSLAPLAFEPLMKTQREPIEISKHGKRVAVLISAEKTTKSRYENFCTFKLNWPSLLLRLKQALFIMVMQYSMSL